MQMPVFDIVERPSTRGLTTFDVQMNGETVANADSYGEADSYVCGARLMYNTIFEPNQWGETPVIYFP